MKQIKVKEFLKLPISQQIIYTSLLECVKPKPLLSVKMSELSYNTVKTLFKEFTRDVPNLEMIFIEAFKMTKEDYLNLPIQNFFILKKYIEAFFVSLRENEIKLLQSINADTSLWDMAGGSELNEFSDVLPLSQLAKIYGGYPFELGDKNYVEIIYLLRMNNKQGQVQHEFDLLKSKQK